MNNNKTKVVLRRARRVIEKQVVRDNQLNLRYTLINNTLATCA